MNVVFKVNDEIKEKLIKYYEPFKKDKEIPYVIFQAVENDTVVTLYTSGKVMFQGTSADIDANMWKEMAGIKDKPKEDFSKYHNCSSVGSDEVGTGDYFGPIVVTAAYVTKDDVEFLDKLGVGDSKKITDDKIKKIAPEIAKRIRYKSLILNNKEYNEKYNSDINMNKIKAIMHNKVLYTLMHEEPIPNVDYIIVDEFAREARYYEYIKEDTNIQRGITFMTKAEDKNLAVASASIISRYLFLKEFDKLCDNLHLPLVKGAGPDVDKIGEELVEKYGEGKLQEVAKVNFKNTERILHTMIM